MMKKKNVLLVSLAFALVAVIAIGATFALLSDSTGPVTNTFTVAGKTAFRLNCVSLNSTEWTSAAGN